MQTIARFVCRLILLVTLGASQTLLAQTMPHQSRFKSIGAVNCASSTCHGSIAERTSTPVMQNEYTTWLRQDPHTQAYAILKNERSRKIAQNLRLPKPAHESKICLDCHGHNPPSALRTERFDASDGVSCEGCHGPAEKWIKTHLEPNATHANNMANGLYPTNQPFAVAKLCLSCHMGDATRPMTHQIMGAGHPRLSAEVDTFMALQPPHYRIDPDWQARKGAFDSVKVWAMGQFVAALNLLDLIADPNRNSQGIFPELMMFDCHACHSSMKKQDWEHGMSSVPGQARINDSGLLMVKAIARAAQSQTDKVFNDQLLELHVSSTSPQSNMNQLVQASTKLRNTVLQLRDQISGTAFNQAMLERLLREIILQANSNNYTDYAGAEQAYMSISAVSNGLAKHGKAKLATAINPALARMLKTLSDENQYDRQAFQNELLGLKALLGETP